uniref:Uncharacterized protein n=1 Tax=viral metagenome TaxID=1070528 RepID=A0A6C0BEP0_9ZZZZ
MYNCIGIFHLITLIVYVTYILWRNLIPHSIRKTCDTVYIFGIMLLLLSWLVCNDKCIITVWYQKLKHQESDKKTPATDFEDMLGPYKRLVQPILIISIIITMIYILLLYNLPLIPAFCLLVFVCVYLWYLRYHKDSVEFTTLKLLITVIIFINIIIYARIM